MRLGLSAYTDDSNINVQPDSKRNRREEDIMEIGEWKEAFDRYTELLVYKTRVEVEQIYCLLLTEANLRRKICIIGFVMQGKWRRILLEYQDKGSNLGSAQTK